ncbi:methylamine utilization protein [Chitinimonas sp. BJB300]|uniref:methylamine utilization protein n=1 Tax=Chitinimonas sp. BJB300 TaxID=1559339 RepID=UPI000C0F9984|nr:methylamine utilization protein [Chitinimonas sp. BJB300]PHV10209.1 methylamine utilization protein [Chitinimonas sp. BJB300]TSJ91099.1 methylamine utilization protein [Chitinimonas sp. BJB300]
MRQVLPCLLALLPLFCAAKLTVQILNPSEQAVGDAVVYAEPLAGKAPKGKLTGTIDQVNKEFVPLVSVVQTGTAIRFPNKDNIRHNIYSFSRTKVFDLRLYSGTPSEPVVFDTPGLVVLGCNIHDWMVGYLLVVDTPWFDTTNTKGLVNLDNLPSGDYSLRVWHPYQSAEIPAQKIRVGPGAETHFVFHMKLSPPPAAAHANY